MRIDASYLLPLGMDTRYHKALFIGGNIISSFLSLGFLYRYFDERAALFVYGPDGVEGIMEGAVMPPFTEVLEKALWGFYITAVCVLLLAIYHAAFFRIGSKSVYLMKRLPQRWELARRIFVLPLAGAAATLLIGAVFCGIYFVLYLLVTPEVCLPYGNLWGSLI